MRYTFIAGLVFLLFYSCNKAEKAPEYVTYRTLPEGSGIEYERKNFYDNHSSRLVEGNYPELDSLTRLRMLFFDKHQQFPSERFRSFWEKFRQQERNMELPEKEALTWFNLTGFLFQLTGDAMVAEELERIVYRYFLYTAGMQPDSVILPYVFTRNTDFIHLNIYLPASIHFEHSLGGNVTVALETGFPESGKARIIFGMDTKQYMEVSVRIPSWAEDASVTVKGVKYLAPPGGYSKIAKKWKEGDVVEVEFPLNNLPSYMKPGS